LPYQPRRPTWQRNNQRRETADLIGSDKVEGTDVYRSNGDHIGEIERVMIEKRTGKVAYAVMSFGGFLGIGEEYYPVPWSLLTYNEKLGGYEVNLSGSSSGERRSSVRTRIGTGATGSAIGASATTTERRRIGCSVSRVTCWTAGRRLHRS